MNESLNAFNEYTNYKSYIQGLKSKFPNVSFCNGTVYYNQTNPYNYIDLGLPSGTLWADKNIGDKKYFAWGETEGFSEGDGRNFIRDEYTKFGQYPNYTKYIIGELETLQLEDDAASVCWNENWSLPTPNQLLELISNTTISYITYGENQGALLTSKINGETIFFPFTGFYKEGDITEQSESVYILSNTLDGTDYSKILKINRGDTSLSKINRWVGCAIRPVRGKEQVRFCRMTLKDGTVIDLEASGTISYEDVSQYSNDVVNLVIGSEFTTIGEGAFNEFNKLETVVISDNVETIKSHAFYQCTSLKEVYLGNSVKVIEDHAFEGCNSLEEIIIPSDIVSIGYSAFNRCESLELITINSIQPPTLELTEYGTLSIFEGLYDDCRILIPEESYELYMSDPNWSYYSERFAIAGESRIICRYRVDDPGTPVRICYNNLSSQEGIVVDVTDNLSDFEIDGEVYDINILKESDGYWNFDNAGEAVVKFKMKSYGNTGTGTFNGCEQLISVLFPYDIYVVGESCFDGCTSLVRLNIPNRIDSICRYSIRGCQSLRQIILPSGLRDIGDYGISELYLCDKLVFKSNSVPILSEYSIYDYGGSIYVPRESINSYIEALPQYEDRIYSINNY